MSVEWAVIEYLRLAVTIIGIGLILVLLRKVQVIHLQATQHDVSISDSLAKIQEHWDFALDKASQSVTSTIATKENTKATEENTIATRDAGPSKNSRAAKQAAK